MVERKDRRGEYRVKRLKDIRRKEQQRRKENKKKAVAMAEIMLAHDVSSKTRGSAFGHPKKLHQVRHAVIRAPPSRSSSSRREQVVALENIVIIGK